MWLGLYAPSEAELGTIADRYGLHPLAVEDAVYAHQRPKLDHYDDGALHGAEDRDATWSTSS